jgi:hypothetical protein
MQPKESIITTMALSSAPNRFIWLVGALAVLFGAVYIYAVSASVLHIVLREEILRETSSLHTDVGELEAKYFALQGSVTRSFSSSSGYISITDKKFVSLDAQDGITLNR